MIGRHGGGPRWIGRRGAGIIAAIRGGDGARTQGLRTFLTSGGLAGGVLAALALALSPGAARAENFAARGAVDSMEQRCRLAGGQPGALAGLTRETRIGATAATVVDFAQFQCKGAPNPACGPFGCAIRVYLGQGTGTAFEGQARAWRVRGARFEITRAGAYCANANSGACSESYELAGGALKLAARGAQSFARDPWRPAVAAPSTRQARQAAPPRGTRGLRGRIAPDSAYEPPAERTGPAQEAAPSAQAQEQRRRTLQSAPYVP